MNSKTKSGSFDARFLLRAILTWFAAAMFLLLVGAIVLTITEMRADGFAYVSSAISFLAAFIAGLVAGAGQHTFDWKMAILCGMTLSVLLLMLGFLAAGDSMAADGVISVVSFTIAGALTGVFFAPRDRRIRQREFSLKNR